MSLQTLTLSIPQNLFHQIKELAQQQNRSVEDESVELLASAVPVRDELSRDLIEAMSSLNLLNDEELWRAARSHLAIEAASELETLHFKQQREGLTAHERETESLLLRQYERVMLVRAKAALLLRERGFDIAELGPTK